MCLFNAGLKETNVFLEKLTAVLFELPHKILKILLNVVYALQILTLTFLPEHTVPFFKM